MSHIPNSAMPHASAEPATDETAAPGLRDRAGKLASEARALLRDNPRTAVAAGAALVAGAVAAVAIPKVRARKASAGKKPSSGGKKGGKKGG